MKEIKETGIATHPNDEAQCPGCQEQLRKSMKSSALFYSVEEDIKTCPECSGRLGRHVWYHLDDFGKRMFQGKEYMQTWCRACRNSEPPVAPAKVCGQDI